MDIKELFNEIEEEVLCANTKLEELQNKVTFLSQLLPNRDNLGKLLYSSTNLYGLVHQKKREFFYETVEIFKNFHNLADSTRDIAYTGLLNIFDEVGGNCIYKDKEYETENKKHLAKLSDYENRLSETEKKIFLEINNFEASYNEIYSNLLFETMLIVSSLLNSVERTKKNYVLGGCYEVQKYK
ncbi:Uncharacterised protein [Sebaldella termitidis]|uniref:Uncharacterized protein n=1 Tax=Sebaldella termitidis (strain ATCC 33386 / NCTC 11300) TaxID=526218 RepID=D1AHN6_SEBTE|nr:hypothetical protein [Sebaldella termitidis]ACZ08270.1 hypothetical protein Sterm_1407 [Sebaldella termitidis ATCC 33386]SUI23578.1 Uncharacterised protein [Sebaldella termitidis]